MNELMDIRKQNPKKTIAFVASIAVVVLVIFLIALPILSKADEAGKSVGQTVGNALGYVNGVSMADTKTAAEEGKNEALNNPETTVKSVNKMKIQDTGRLDVMAAGIILDNFREIEEKYAALYLIKADAIFSVDLGLAEVKWGEDHTWARIIVPQPEVTVYINEEKTEKIAEWQKSKFTGKAEDGFKEYLSTMEDIAVAAPEELMRNETMMQNARTAAERQIKLLASGIYGNDVEVTVEFQ